MRLCRIKMIVRVSAFQDSPEYYVKVSLHLFNLLIVHVFMDLHKEVSTVGPLCSRHHWDPAAHLSFIDRHP